MNRSLGKKRRSSRGSALMEAAMVIPFFLVVLAGVVTFGRWYLIRNRLVATGQYGAWLKKAGCAPRDIRERLLLEWARPMRSSVQVRVEGQSLPSFFPSVSQVVVQEVDVRPSWLLSGVVAWKPMVDRCLLTVDAWAYGIPHE